MESGMNILRRLAVVVIALGSMSVASAYPIPVLEPFIPGVGLQFGQYCCISYNATTDLLVAATNDEMQIYDGSIAFDGTWLLETHINEEFQVTDPGSVSLFGDIGNGYELLLGGHVTGIGFWSSYTEPQPYDAFYGVSFMGIVFEIISGNDFMTSLFGGSGTFLTGVEIGDYGPFLPGSPFAQDFQCGADAFRCDQWEGSYGLNRLASVPEPGTLALIAIGLAGMGLARRRRHLP
jgi:hypothetical protein